MGMLIKGTKLILRSIYPNAYLALAALLNSEESSDEFAMYRGTTKMLDQKKITEAFKGSLNRFVYSSCSLGIEPILMTQPNRIDSSDFQIRKEFEKYNPTINFDSYSESYKKLNDIIRDTAKSHGIVLIDAARNIPKHKQYIFDAVHFTDKGSELMAEVISKELARKIKQNQAENNARLCS